MKTAFCSVSVVRFSGFGNKQLETTIAVPETMQQLWSSLLLQRWGLISGDLVKVDAGPLCTGKCYAIWRSYLI